MRTGSVPNFPGDLEHVLSLSAPQHPHLQRSAETTHRAARFPGAEKQQQVAGALLMPCCHSGSG
jgi:hypothetical protein